MAPRLQGQFTCFLVLCMLSLVHAWGYRSCDKVPVSFSTDLELVGKKSHSPLVWAHVSLKKGYVSASFRTSKKCKLVKAVAVSVGQKNFPCSTYAHGHSASVSCPISKFSIENCCAAKYSVSLAAIVVCGYSYPEKATVSADVSTKIDCPLCTFCNSKAAACTAVADGSTPSGCDGKKCIHGSPAKASCQKGTCKFSIFDKCGTCTSCAGGDCKPVEKDEKCAGKFCVDGKPAENKCFDGKCIKKVFDFCPTCQTCDSGSCVAVDEDKNCKGKKCLDSKTPAAKKCHSGKCILAKLHPCPLCQGCDSGSCVAISKDSGCFGNKCVDKHTVGTKKCHHGSCVLGKTSCDKCDSCGDGKCSFDKYKCPPKPKYCWKNSDCPHRKKCVWGKCVRRRRRHHAW